jgi:hypothetical protein
MIIERLDDDSFFIKEEYSGKDIETGEEFFECETKTTRGDEYDSTGELESLIWLTLLWACPMGITPRDVILNSRNIKDTIEGDNFTLVDNRHLPDDWDNEIPVKLIKETKFLKD